MVFWSVFSTFSFPAKRTLCSFIPLLCSSSRLGTMANHMVFSNSFLSFTVFRYVTRRGRLCALTCCSSLVLVTRSAGRIPFSLTLYWSKNVLTPSIFSINGFTTFTKSSFVCLQKSRQLLQLAISRGRSTSLSIVDVSGQNVLTTRSRTYSERFSFRASQSSLNAAIRPVFALSSTTASWVFSSLLTSRIFSSPSLPMLRSPAVNFCPPSPFSLSPISSLVLISSMARGSMAMTLL